MELLGGRQFVTFSAIILHNLAESSCMWFIDAILVPTHLSTPNSVEY